MSQPFPFVPEDLLRALKERFPDRLPAHPVSEADIAYQIGIQKVIRFLDSQQQDQAERLLKGEGV